jgi:hypothetical protein
MFILQQQAQFLRLLLSDVKLWAKLLNSGNMKDHQYLYIVGLLASIKTDTMEDGWMVTVGLYLALGCFILAAIQSWRNE